MPSAITDPRHLSHALSELTALRGLDRIGEDRSLSSTWKAIAGETIAADTRVLGVKRGVLEIAVTNAPLLGELAAFHKRSLLEAFRKRHPDLDVRDLRFRLKGDLLSPE